MKPISVYTMLLNPVSALACGTTPQYYSNIIARVKVEMFKNAVKLNSAGLTQAADWIARAEKAEAQHREDWDALNQAIKMLGVKVGRLPKVLAI